MGFTGSKVNIIMRDRQGRPETLLCNDLETLDELRSLSVSGQVVSVRRPPHLLIYGVRVAVQNLAAVFDSYRLQWLDSFLLVHMYVLQHDSM